MTTNLKLNWTRLDAPCLGCKVREMGCHSKCEKYITWHEAHEEEKNQIKVELKKDTESIAIEVQRAERIQKYRKGRDKK